MPKILRIINRFNLGGITYNVSYLSKYLDQDYETLLVGGPEEESEKSSLFIPHSLGLHPMLIPEMRRSLNPLRDFAAFRRIQKIIKEFRPDIVHTHASKAGAIGRLAAISCGVRHIVHTYHGHVFRNYFGSVKTKTVIAIERFLAARTSAIITISERQKREIVEEFRICRPDQAKVVELGFDLERFTVMQDEKRRNFRNQFHIGDEELAIGIIGRLAPIKNHELFIDAILHLYRNTKKRFCALVIGDGETRQHLENYVQQKGGTLEKNGQGPRFIFTSWINDADRALAGLDLVCLTSKNEGTPVSLIEAQAAGKFIVSTDVGGIRDILTPGCGLLSNPDDVQKYQANLVHAIEHFDALNKTAANGRERVLVRFSYKRLCRDMALVYAQLLSEQQTPKTRS